MRGVKFANTAELVQTVIRAAGAGVMAMAKVVQNDIRASFPSAGRYNSSPAGGPPNKRRGNLRNTIQVVKHGPLAARVGTNRIDAIGHELGNTIFAKPGKYLAVPINPQASRLSEKNGWSLRSLGQGNVTFLRSKGKLIAIGKTAVDAGSYDASGRRKRNMGAPAWVLKPSVTLPARPFLRPALERAKGNPEVIEAFINGANARLGNKGVTLRRVA